jgi:hypothetical protein
MLFNKGQVWYHRQTILQLQSHHQVRLLEYRKFVGKYICVGPPTTVTSASAKTTTTKT